MRERWGGAFDETWNQDLDDIAATYVDQGAQVLVLEDNGRIVATGMLLRVDEDAGQIVRMSVDPMARRRGHGRRIVDELIARARRQGLSTVIVLTDTPWASAVAFYAACGFVQTLQSETDTEFRLSLRAETAG